MMNKNIVKKKRKVVMTNTAKDYCNGTTHVLRYGINPPFGSQLTQSNAIKYIGVEEQNGLSRITSLLAQSLGLQQMFQLKKISKYYDKAILHCRLNILYKQITRRQIKL
jgi:hypothetical protein